MFVASARPTPGVPCLSCSKEPSLNLLEMLLLMPPSKPKEHTASSWAACCPPAPPGPSLQSCIPAVQPQPVQVPRVVPSQVQDLAFAFVKFETVAPCPSLQPVEVLLKGSTTLWWTIHSSQPCAGISIPLTF